MMKLREYLDKYGVNITKFARQLKISESTVHNILKGYEIKLSVALKIVEHTDGLVTCMDMKPTKRRGVPVAKKR